MSSTSIWLQSGGEHLVYSAVCLWVKVIPSTDHGFNLKALDMFGNCQRPVFSVGVSQNMHTITNLGKLWLNWSSKLQESNERKNTLVILLCVLESYKKPFQQLHSTYCISLELLAWGIFPVLHGLGFQSLLVCVGFSLEYFSGVYLPHLKLKLPSLTFGPGLVQDTVCYSESPWLHNQNKRDEMTSIEIQTLVLLISRASVRVPVVTPVSLSKTLDNNDASSFG